MDSSGLQNLFGVWGTSVNRDFGALSLVHYISGILGDRICGVVIQTNIGELGGFSSYI